MAQDLAEAILELALPHEAATFLRMEVCRDAFEVRCNGSYFLSVATLHGAVA